MIAGIVSIGVGWMLSGAQQTFDASQRAALLQVAAKLAAEYPRLVFRNPDKVTQGWELARKQRAIRRSGRNREPGACKHPSDVSCERQRHPCPCGQPEIMCTKS